MRSSTPMFRYLIPNVVDNGKYFRKRRIDFRKILKMSTNTNHSVLTNSASPVDRVNKLNTVAAGNAGPEEDDRIQILA